MSFPESTKLTVKRKADFSCCWCRDRHNKVDVHHIIPEAQGGSDEEDNAAPLCGSCHDKYGGNPNLRKEITLRRDQWYEICAKLINPQYGWPIGLDVPVLSFSRAIPATSSVPTVGIQFTDKDPGDSSNPPLLYVTTHFKRSRYFGRNLPDEDEKWLYVETNMRFALNLRIQVQAQNDRDVSSLMVFLTKGEERYLPDFVRAAPPELRRQYIADLDRGWALYGPAPSSDRGSGDYLRVWREHAESRLMISTFTPTHAGISIHARFTDAVSSKFAHYLDEAGFANGDAA